MIPATSGILLTDFTISGSCSNTWRLDTDQGLFNGYADGPDAVRQAIYIILSTERYQHEIFSWNFGVELGGLFGEPSDYVIPELERRIGEALMWDERITGVGDFEFKQAGRKLLASFTVNTVYGAVRADKTIEI